MTLPHNIELEKTLIGEILLDNSIIDDVIEILEPNHSYDGKHQIVFNAIKSIHLSGKGVDIIQLYDYLKGDPEYTASYLSKFQQDVHSSANCIQHAQLVFQDWVLREVVKDAQNTIASVGKSDCFELLEKSQSNLDRLNNIANGILEKDKDLFQSLDEVIPDLERRMKEENQVVLKSEYLPSFNRMTRGIMPGNLVSIQGKDKAGKTTLAYTLTTDFAVNQKIPVAIFTLEVSFVETIWKIINTEIGVEYNKLRNPRGYINKQGKREGKLEESELTNLKTDVLRFKDTKIIIIDQMLNEHQIYSKVKQLKREHGIEWFVVDYIGLIEPSGQHESREKAIGYISRFFKKVGKELQIIPCILSQQNRDGGIAESKGLERDSDFSFSIHKPFEEVKDTVKRSMVYIDLDGNKQTITNPIDNDFLVQLKRSRHGHQGRSFRCAYNDNNQFREVSNNLPF